MKRRLWIVVIGALLVQTPVGRCENAESILEKIGVTRGICVVLGDTACDLAVDIVQKSRLIVYVQIPKAGDVETVRRAIDAAGLYGTRVFVDEGSLAALHLADNIADAVVVAGKEERIPVKEVMRVLRPGGKALLQGAVAGKPFPKGADDWGHPYHGPDNNPQSRDEIIRAPYLTQFLADPRYAPVPQVAVASAGRLLEGV